MARRKSDNLNTTLEADGEVGHFANVVVKVIQSMTAQQARYHGEDILQIVNRETPVNASLEAAAGGDVSLHQLKLVAQELASKDIKPSRIDKVCAWVGEIFGLDHVEIAILAVFVRWGKIDAWREIVRASPFRCGHLTPGVVACLSGTPKGLTEQKLMPGSRLLLCRLVNDDNDGEFNLSPLLIRLTRIEAESRDDMMRWLMPDPESSNLAWEEFAHIGPLRDIALDLLSSPEPVSILLYGEPGGGKTEFARTVAQRAGRGATFVGLSDDEGGEPSRGERLDHAIMLRTLCRSRKDRLLVIDEADDVLTMSERRGSSKQWINRFVETPEVSTIWIVNDRLCLDPSVLRRMTLAVHLGRPSRAVRERVVKTAADRASLPLSSADVRELASIKATPAVITSGLRAARLVDGGMLEAKMATQSLMRAMGQSCSPEVAGDTHYDPELSSADIDIARLAERLRGSQDRRWSLLLAGPSGTGKTAFARHLAQLMGIDIEERRCSDLISPYVGVTEQNIAEAFATASERAAMLLIDEIDSFLYRREAGQRSWEVSQVNEMLVQLEHLRTPFVATTNLADNLDPATQRRFTIRATFNAMTPAQASQLFKARFGIDWPLEWPIHHGQTPGDFAVVAHRANLLAERDPAVLVRWLRDEIEARGDRARGTMGFHIHSDTAPPRRAERLDEAA